MMSSAHTAATLAQALGVAKSTLLRRAEAEGWPFEERAGLGGKRRHYMEATLPEPVRRALGAGPGPAAVAAQAGVAQAAQLALGNALQATAASVRRQAALRQGNELPATARTRMDAKLGLLRAWELYAKASPLPTTQARLAFCLAYNAGQVEVPPEVRAGVPQAAPRSLERWADAVRKEGITALAGAYGNRLGTGRIDAAPELRAYVQAMLVQYPHTRATHVMEGLSARYGATHALPSIRGLERWMLEWRQANAELVMALADPDAWKNKFMTAFGSRSEAATAINALWERDSSPADVMCTDGRYSLIGGIDVFTRSAHVLLAKTSKAVAVGAHLRGMLLAYGVPTVDKTDNGSDYTAHYTERVYRSLDIDHQTCKPFSPWEKPHIERFFGTFTRGLAELLPGFIGHNVAERSAIEARKSFADRLMKPGEVVEVNLSGEQLQAFITQWVNTVYDQAPHQGLNGRTPFEVRAGHSAQVHRITDEHALDVLLAPAPGRDGKRTVQKKGILLDDGWYIAPELEAWLSQEVHVRFDPVHHDLGTLYVFGGDEQRFICLAQCPERTGVDRRAVALQASHMQKQRVQAERRALRAAAKKVGVDQVVQEVLAAKATAAGKLHALPRATSTHTSPGLEAAAQAYAAANAPRRTTADLENLAEVRAAQQRIAAAQVPPGQANELAERRAAGGALPTPVFNSVVQRVQWLLAQAHVRALSLEEQDALARFKREQPASYLRLQASAHEQQPQRPQATEEPQHAPLKAL